MKKTRVGLVLALLLLPAVQGCGGASCGSKADQQQRDACYFESLGGQLQKGDLEAIKETIQAIESPMVRSAAVRQVLSSPPQNLTQGEAEALCGRLDPNESANCLKTWQRPHLWGGG